MAAPTVLLRHGVGPRANLHHTTGHARPAVRADRATTDRTPMPSAARPTRARSQSKTAGRTDAVPSAVDDLLGDDAPATGSRGVPGKAAAGSNVAEFSVSELSATLKRSIEDAFDHVRVRGEVGRVSRPGSGHVYLDLKDRNAVLAGVIWRGVAGRLAIQPEMGLEVVATGRLTTFPGQSKYQIVIEQLEPAGIGALMALLEERRKKFQAEGLFDEERKRAVPFLPRVVGIVTSPSGAVIRDMMHGFAERCPVRVVVWPVRVQGETCAQEVARAIHGFNAMPASADPARAPAETARPDVIIVARGGGSIEDLWGFNEEAVVRAAAQSAIPLISAVGHETDWTLLDHVADARAPTPTKAAEWAVPKKLDLLERLDELGQRGRHALQRRLSHDLQRLKAAARGLPRAEDLVAPLRQRLDLRQSQLNRAMLIRLQAARTRVERAGSQLNPRVLAANTQAAARQLGVIGERAGRALLRATERRRDRLAAIGERLTVRRVAEPVHAARRRLDETSDRLDRAARARFAQQRAMLAARADMLRSLSHRSVLERGFAIVRAPADPTGAPGGIVRNTADARRVASLDIQFADGSVAAEVCETAPRSEPTPPTGRKGQSSDGVPQRGAQKSLF